MLVALQRVDDVSQNGLQGHKVYKFLICTTLITQGDRESADCYLFSREVLRAITRSSFNYTSKSHLVSVKINMSASFVCLEYIYIYMYMLLYCH